MATVFMVVCFTYIFTTAPVTHAADAEWSGDAISYNQQTYTKLGESKGTESHGIPKGAQIYSYTEGAGTTNAGSLQKAHLIFFPSGTDPATASNASYRTYDVAGQRRYTNPSATTSITLGGTAPAPANPGTTSCAVDGIGWIICPVTNFLAKGMDVIYSWIDGFLEVRPLATTQDQALYRAWSYMRTFANIAFIIGFLVIIYSQISNYGLSNYDIKKMLPRIVIAAILVNVSYWICAISVDIFNILGYSIQDLFIMMRNTLVGEEGNSWQVISWESMSSLILSGGSLAGGAGIATYLGITSGALALAGTSVASGLLFLLLPLLLSILFVVLMTFLILAARQAIITIFIIIAPLAFVAFLLPNTEKWFEKWRSTFFTLLLLFPAFSLVFGGSQLAAAAIIQNAQGASALNTILLGMAVQVAPLAITPLLLKLGGGVLNRFAGIVNNPTKGIFDRGKNWAKERNDQNKAAGLAALDRRAKDRGFVNGRPVNGSWRDRTRLNPNNMAYLREYNRRERTGMKSANEAMSESLFSTQTAAGTRIHDRNKDAGLEKHFGEGNQLEAYNNAVYGTPGVAGSGDPYRQNLHHAAHTASGRAKLVEDAATGHAERDLQNQISSTAALRNMKVGTDVDNAHAEFLKSNLAAEGKAAFKREFEDGTLGGRALRVMNVQTSNLEKEAASIDTMLTKRAEADWERRSSTDDDVQRLRLKETEAADSYARAEKEWQSTIAEIKTKGATASSLVDPADIEVRAMANAIKVDTRATLVQEQRLESAKVTQKSDFANALKADAALRAEAAGIDPHGETRVLAAAKKAVSDELIKATNNFQDTLDYDIASSPNRLESAFKGTTEMSEKIAYARILARNAPGLKKLKPLLEDFTAGKNPLDDEVMLLKEVLAGDDTFRNAGRDLEVWANNEINPDTNRAYTDFAEVRNAASPYTNITATRFTRMNAYSQQETLWWLQQNAPDRLNVLLEGIGDERGQIWRELKGSIREDIETIRNGNQIPNPN